MATSKILLLEADDAVHGALTEVLRQAGYDVLHAFRPEDSTFVAALHPDLDLAILGLPSPAEPNGPTWEHFLAQNPLLPVIFLVAHLDHRRPAEGAGAEIVLPKSIDPSLLLERIQRLLALSGKVGVVSTSDTLPRK